MIALLCLLVSLELAAPTIDLEHCTIGQIRDAVSGVFTLSGMRVAPPASTNGQHVSVVIDTVVVASAVIKDYQTGATYKLITASPARLMEDGSYAVDFKVTGGKFPLRRGQLSVWMEIRLTAHSRSEDGTTSVSVSKTQVFSLSREDAFKN